MSTLDLLTDTFPHGTPDGYRLGCRTAACPAVLPCRTVHSRYCGDFTFAKLIDAGVPLPEILEREAAENEGIRQRDKIAAREERRAADPTPGTSGSPRPSRRSRSCPQTCRPGAAKISRSTAASSIDTSASSSSGDSGEPPPARS